MSLNAKNVLATTFVVVTATACTQLPRADQITDLRVLAVRTEPAEIVYSPLLLAATGGPPAGAGGGGGAPGGAGEGEGEGEGGAPPSGFTVEPVDVDVEVFAFDPRGGHVTTSLSLCRDDPDDAGCLARSDDDVLVAGDDGSGDVDTDASAAGLVPFNAATFTFDQALLSAALLGQQTSLATPVTPRFAFSVENGADSASTGATNADGDIVRERGIKRLPLTIDVGDPSAPSSLTQPLLDAFDVVLCSADEEARAPVPGPATCFRRPVANTNPDLLGFVFARDLQNPDGTDGNVFLDVDVDTPSIGTVKVSAGDELRIDPVLTASSIEAQQGFEIEIQSGKTTLHNRTENIACQWFATSGDVSRATASMNGAPIGGGPGGGPSDGSIGITWTAPADKKHGDSDSVVVVVEDQRGGVAVGRIEVEY